MNENNSIPSIGDVIKYNGNISDYISDYDRDFIRDNLVIGESYKVIKSKTSSCTFINWIEVKKNDRLYVWAPIDCFDIDYRYNISKKYGLK